MLVVVTYDVADDRRRYRVAKLLEGFGTRVLESVFECDLTLAQRTRLERRLQRLLRVEEDGARVYSLGESCKAQTRIYGQGKLETSAPYDVV